MGCGTTADRARRPEAERPTGAIGTTWGLSDDARPIRTHAIAPPATAATTTSPMTIDRRLRPFGAASSEGSSGTVVVSSLMPKSGRRSEDDRSGNRKYQLSELLA